MLCSHFTLSSSKTFLSPPTETPYPLNDHSPRALPQPLVTPIWLSVFMDWPVLEISYKWTHIICNLLCLASFIQHHIFKVRPHCARRQCFTPFYGWIVFHCTDGLRLLIHISLMGIWVVFTFWLLWIVLVWILCSSFALNTCFHSFGYVHRSGTAGSYGTSTFNLLRNSQTVFHSGCTTVHPTSNIAEFWSLHILAKPPSPPWNANTTHTPCISLCTMAMCALCLMEIFAGGHRLRSLQEFIKKKTLLAHEKHIHQPFGPVDCHVADPDWFYFFEMCIE